MYLVFLHVRREENIPNEAPFFTRKRALTIVDAKTSGGPQMRLGIYSISLFLEGSVEDTSGLV